jgi:DNA-binding HxlR family transcriptional regulator
VDGTDSRNENLDIVRERFNVVTQETRFSLVQDILGHPSGPPMLKELNYVNPNRSQTTIRQHLQQLIETDIVEKVELPEDRRQNDLPYPFYGLSKEGRRFLEEYKLLRAEETLQEIYDRVEKTAEVVRYESAQCPEQ